MFQRLKNHISNHGGAGTCGCSGPTAGGPFPTSPIDPSGSQPSGGPTADPQVLERMARHAQGRPCEDPMRRAWFKWTYGTDNGCKPNEICSNGQCTDPTVAPTWAGPELPMDWKPAVWPPKPPWQP